MGGINNTQMSDVSVPTVDTTKSAGKAGLTNGLVGGVGTAVGSQVLGNGLGTAIGGIVAAGALEGADRDMVATIAVMQGIGSLGSGSAGGASSSNSEVM